MHTGQPAPAQGILALLKELFVHHGHMVTDDAQLEGKSGQVYQVPLLAESEVGAIVAGAFEGPGALAAAQVEEFEAIVADTAADRGILCHLGAAEPEARHAARHTLLWDRQALVRLVGEACLAEALGETAPALSFEAPRESPLPTFPDGPHSSARRMLDDAAEPTDAGEPAERLVAEDVADLLPAAFLSPEPSPVADAPDAPDFTPSPEADATPDFAAFAGVFASQPEATAADPALDAAPLAAADAPQPRKSFSPWADMRSASDSTLPPLAASQQPDAFPSAPPPTAVPPLVAPAPVLGGPLSGPTFASPVPTLQFSSPVSTPPRPAMPALDAATAPAPPRIAVPDSPFGMLLAASSAAPATRPAGGPQATAGAPWAAPSLPASDRPGPAAAPFSPWNAPASSTAPAPAPASATPRTYSRRVLPAKLRPEDAHRKVKDRLYSLQAVELVLHPVHLYDYECDILQEGKLSFDTADGRLQVHGADKSTLDVDPDAANPDAPTLLPAAHPYNVTERVLRIPEERAAQLALQHVTRKHSRTIDVRVPDQNHSLYYTERRKLEPTADQVRLHPLGIFFRPVWRLHGDNGFVDVDALDGRELDAQLVGSRHGAVLLE